MGLIHDCKSNIERMAERIPESDYDQMHHFISESPWDSFWVMETVAESVQVTLSSSSSAVSQAGVGLLIDESGWEKSGKKSVGVARQYIGQAGKVANGQVGVFAALSNGEQIGLVQGRLYLPQAWVGDSERCKKAGVPEKDRVYRTKPELAVEILKTLPTAVRYDWVGGDCIYGNSPVLRQHLYSVNQAFVVDVSEELGVYLTPPAPYIPDKKSERGRTPLRYVCDEKPILLKDLITQIPDGRWETITHRQGTKGPLIRKAVILPVYIWNPARPTVIESVQLIISTEPDGSEKKYSVCWDNGNDMPLAIALYRQMQRYWVERAFQNVKEQLGLHQYQVRSWKAWYHHIALTLMALQFILEVQCENKEEMPLLSVPDIKLIFAKKLLNNLNTDDGLIQALNTRHRLRRRDIDWRGKVPK
jgi:SRSO17 transposase